MAGDAVDRIESLLDQVCAPLARCAEGKGTLKPSELRYLPECAARARTEVRALRGAPTRDRISDAQRIAVLTRDGYKCRRCGGTAAHVDHIIPVARYGTSKPDNLQSLCGPCNLAKGASL